MELFASFYFTTCSSAVSLPVAFRAGAFLPINLGWDYLFAVNERYRGAQAWIMANVCVKIEGRQILRGGGGEAP